MPNIPNAAPTRAPTSASASASASASGSASSSAAASAPTSAPVAIRALDAPPRSKPSSYPEPFAARMGGREKRALGDVFGLRNFGVNLTRLAPGAISALRHAHSKQDEFVYILQGHPTLIVHKNGTP